MCKTRYELIIDYIDDTINKSSINAFKQFIESNKKYAGWVIVSDYCIDDDKKFNDCLSFSISPMDKKLFFKISKEIKENIPKDLKHTKSISDNSLHFLRENRYFFTFNFIIKDIKNLLGNLTNDEKKTILRNEIDKLINNMGEENPSYKRYKNIFNNHFVKNNFNTNLYAKVAFIAFLAAYLRVLILKHDKRNGNTICWLSDRGNAMSSFDNFYADLHQLYYELLLEKENIICVEKSVLCALIKENADIFYDEFIKIPDYMAGALSSYEYETNNTDKDKHTKLIEECIADNGKIINLILFLKDDIQCGRLIINK